MSIPSPAGYEAPTQNDIGRPVSACRVYPVAKRVFDVCLALSASALLILPMLLIAALIKITSKGPVLHWSKRVGRDNALFPMPKFRTMRVDTPQLATHLLTNSDAYITALGAFLRKTSLDELPQLFSILKGDISFVGPRPALFNQDDLIALRTQRGVSRLIPGLTGWAQVNGRDLISIPQKVELDAWYLHHVSFWLDLKILIITVLKVVRTQDISC